MGLLTRLWVIKCGILEGELENVTLTHEDMNELIEQTIIISGQVFNNVSCHKRIQAISFLLNGTQATRMFKAKASLLSQIQKCCLETLKPPQKRFYVKTQLRTRIHLRSPFEEARYFKESEI